MPASKTAKIHMGFSAGTAAADKARSFVKDTVHGNQGVLGGGGARLRDQVGGQNEILYGSLKNLAAELKRTTSSLKDVNKELVLFGKNLKGVSGPVRGGTGTSGGGEGAGGGGWGSGSSVLAGMGMTIGNTAINMAYQAMSAVVSPALSKLATTRESALLRIQAGGAMDWKDEGRMATFDVPFWQWDYKKDPNAKWYNPFKYTVDRASMTKNVPFKRAPEEEAKGFARIMGLEDEETQAALSTMALQGMRGKSLDFIMPAIVEKQVGLEQGTMGGIFRGARGAGMSEASALQTMDRISGISTGFGGDQGVVYVREMVKLLQKQVEQGDKNLDQTAFLYGALERLGATPERAGRIAEGLLSAADKPQVDVSNLGFAESLGKKYGLNLVDAQYLARGLTTATQEDMQAYEQKIKEGVPISEQERQRYQAIKDFGGPEGVAIIAARENAKKLQQLMPNPALEAYVTGKTPKEIETARQLGQLSDAAVGAISSQMRGMGDRLAPAKKWIDASMGKAAGGEAKINELRAEWESIKNQLLSAGWEVIIPEFDDVLNGLKTGALTADQLFSPPPQRTSEQILGSKSEVSMEKISKLQPAAKDAFAKLRLLSKERLGIDPALTSAYRPPQKGSRHWTGMKVDFKIPGGWEENLEYGRKLVKLGAENGINLKLFDREHGTGPHADLELISENTQALKEATAASKQVAQSSRNLYDSFNLKATRSAGGPTDKSMVSGDW